jgi:hypothetical protein
VSAVEQHAPEALCFYCASDIELGRAVAGQPHRTIHMDGSAEACPVWTPLPASSVGRDTYTAREGDNANL